MLSSVTLDCQATKIVRNCQIRHKLSKLSEIVMSPHHSNQMSQRSQVSRIAPWRCSLNVFVFVIVFVFVFVFVIVFFLVGSCLLVTLITCLKGHKSLRVLYGSLFQKCLGVSEWVSDEATYRAVPLFSEGQLKIRKYTCLTDSFIIWLKWLKLTLPCPSLQYCCCSTAEHT